MIAPDVSLTSPAIVPLAVCAPLLSGNRQTANSMGTDAIRWGLIAFSFALTGRYPARRFSEDPWVQVILRQIRPKAAPKMRAPPATPGAPRAPDGGAVARV